MGSRRTNMPHTPLTDLAADIEMGWTVEGPPKAVQPHDRNVHVATSSQYPGHRFFRKRWAASKKSGPPEPDCPSSQGASSSLDASPTLARRRRCVQALFCFRAKATTSSGRLTSNISPLDRKYSSQTDLPEGVNGTPSPHPWP